MGAGMGLLLYLGVLGCVVLLRWLRLARIRRVEAAMLPPKVPASKPRRKPLGKPRAARRALRKHAQRLPASDCGAEPEPETHDESNVTDAPDEAPAADSVVAEAARDSAIPCVVAV